MPGRRKKTTQPAAQPAAPPAAEAPLTCPCGTGQRYAECCGPLHRGLAAASAEQLMRSRYSAFAVADAGYLLRTWHPDTRPPRLDLEPGQRWTGLAVLATRGGGLFDAAGTVEFRAGYRYRGTTGSLHEHSRFVREDGRWYYLGEDPTAG